MARVFTPRVNRHVTYIRPDGRRRPATITSVNGSLLGLRVGHHGEVYTDVHKSTFKEDTNSWEVASSYSVSQDTIDPWGATITDTAFYDGGDASTVATEELDGGSA